MEREAAAAAKVRVVRCPKCDKLLPELPNFTVYSCGGCGATLQAKPQTPSPQAPPTEAQMVGPVPDDSTREKEEAPTADFNADELVRQNIEIEKSRPARPQLHQKPLSKRPMERIRAAPASHRAPPPPPPMESSHLSPYFDQGPSNYHAERPGRVNLLEQDRAELLRKLDELRDQLRNSGEIADRPGIVYNDRARFYPEGSSSLNHTSRRRAAFLGGQREDMGRLNQFPAPPPVPPPGRAPFHPPPQYLQRQFSNYSYNRFDPDPVVLYHHDGFYRHDGFYHQPSCSCLQCYNHHWLPPVAHGPPQLVYSSSQRVPGLGSNNGLYHHQRVPNGPFQSQEPRIQPRAMPAKKDELRACQPIAGAAPFIACHKCLKLLQIPENFSLVERKPRKLRCGFCSEVISLEFDGKQLVASALPQALLEKSDDMKEDSKSHGSAIERPFDSYSGDYASVGYEFHSTDEKLVLPAHSSSPSQSPLSSEDTLGREYMLNLSESEKRQGLSFSSTTSNNLESPDSVIGQRDLATSSELPLGEEAASHVASLPLREHFGYSPPNQVIDRSGKGSRSRRSEKEKIVFSDTSFKQNSVKDVMVASEMHFSADDYENPGLSQDSWEEGKDEVEPRIVKGGDSFFAGFLKKSLRLNQSTESGRSRVSINGHPISERAVKKAEKLAGPIHSGAYWYDYRAGFWGVIGHQCLGIIPPFIEEFNYPMPKNCAGGITGVLVNGRELNQKDLDLLAGRGLPATEGRSYIVDITGKVWDEASGEELDSLGKLAPTVEKVKHGFGMRAPRIGT